MTTTELVTDTPAEQHTGQTSVTHTSESSPVAPEETKPATYQKTEIEIAAHELRKADWLKGSQRRRKFMEQKQARCAAKTKEEATTEDWPAAECVHGFAPAFLCRRCLDAAGPEAVATERKAGA